MYFGFRTYFRHTMHWHTATRRNPEDMIKLLAASWPDLLWPMTVSKGEVIAGAKSSAHGALRHWRERRQL